MLAEFPAHSRVSHSLSPVRVATDLRLHPNRRPHLRRLPPLRVGPPASGVADFRGVTGGDCDPWNLGRVPTGQARLAHPASPALVRAGFGLRQP